MSADLLLALTAGMLPAVNPCGFALLPAYLSLLVLGGDRPGRGAALRRALLSTGCLTLGFIAVFGILGLVISPIASGVQRYLPWVTVVLGLLLIVAGGWLLTGRSLPALGWSPKGSGLNRRFGSMVAFGAYVAYYGGWELRVLAGGPAADGVIRAAADVQGRLAATVAGLGVPGVVFITLGLLVLAFLIGVLRRGRRRTVLTRSGG